MQREVLARWRRHTRYKQDKAARRRRAVRHRQAGGCKWALPKAVAGACRLRCWLKTKLALGVVLDEQGRTSYQSSAFWRRYLGLLQLGLAGWRAYHALQQQKRHNATALASHYQRQLVRRALSAWSGPFLQAARLQRDRMAAAGAQYRLGLLRVALHAWRGPFLAAARARRQADQRAATFWRANVLLAAFGACRAFLAGRQAKRARLAELQRGLQPGRRRSALRAWQLAQQALAEMRSKVGGR